ncbi:MAG: hypothetical protein J6P09_00535 [Methanobrevibacter sp.]|nr:hypothetical protein [Methanobrevibacter sp.]
MDLTNKLENFWECITKNNKEDDIYSEISFQHELGIYLRDVLSKDYKVQFEHNVDFFFDTTEDFVKKEIDLVVYKCDGDKKYSLHAIELKYPKNGRVPDTMYDFVKDIKFMEQLKKEGFDNTYCITIVKTEDHLFYSGPKTDGIYQYFRTNKEIHKEIYQQTGKGKKTDDPTWNPIENKNYYHIDGKYLIEWRPVCNKKWMMYQIKTNNDD